MKIHPLITTTDAQLAEFCARASPNPTFIAVDTEFMRENTYYPELCLVQMADQNEAAAIDPQSPRAWTYAAYARSDGATTRDVLKVFHAGGQDIEIIL